MKNIKYYLETTVFNFVFADDAPEKTESTKKFLENVSAGSTEIFVSEIVLAEINRAQEPKKGKMLELIEKYNVGVINQSAEAEELAKRYVAEGVIPQKFDNDALHIAIATVNDIDVIISWNLEHIVKLKTKMAVEWINRQMGYKTIEIATPEEAL
ncbi:MAG: PIN domain-containing protein [Candidatus Omnitrophica bacterium]|nr:PIN domain-containing protein [Candidatus Omnitrophota bacterium]